MARMAAIVDVYDAITADRCYHPAWRRPRALRKMWWTSGHGGSFTLVFYPVGSPVLLEPGRLGWSSEQNEKSVLTPVNRFSSAPGNGYHPENNRPTARPPGSNGPYHLGRVARQGAIDPVKFMPAVSTR